MKRSILAVLLVTALAASGCTGRNAFSPGRSISDGPILVQQVNASGGFESVLRITGVNGESGTIKIRHPSVGLATGIPGKALYPTDNRDVYLVDAMVMKFGVLAEHPARRHVRLLAADLAFRLPFAGHLARKMGNTLATPEDALRLLHTGELVGVFPEGYKGVGKGWKERYRLQRFGRGGFIELALRAGAPIIPVAIVGSEEIYPMIGNAKLLARIGGFPYFPITPFFPWLGPLGLLPLPSKWIVEFGEPIPTDGYPDDAWQDAMLVFNETDRIRDQIQQMLYRNLMSRRSAFF